MKNNLGPSRRGKGAAVGLVICFVAVIALVGFFTFSRYKRDMSRQLAKAEEKTDTEEKQKKCDLYEEHTLVLHGKYNTYVERYMQETV